VAMHAVRESLLRAQAESTGLPLVAVPIPYPCPNEAYEEAMAAALLRARAEGITHMIFGDLFLEDIRRYREEKLAGTGITPVFPLWGINTTQLAREMVEGGLRAILTCVDPGKLDASFAGRLFEADLLADLPPDVDPCGENGEFHTFACRGPMFREPIDVEPGVVLERDGFVFADALPRQPA
jgi:diphthamide synthase (EF-2-diphthine--ammonia ligase)